MLATYMFCSASSSNTGLLRCGAMGEMEATN